MLRRKKTVTEELENIVSHVYKFIEKNPGCKEPDVSRYLSELITKYDDFKHKSSDRLAEYAVFRLEKDKAVRYVNGCLEAVHKEKAKEKTSPAKHLLELLKIYSRPAYAAAIFLAIALFAGYGVVNPIDLNITAMAVAENSETGLSWLIAILLLLVLKYLLDKASRK